MQKTVELSQVPHIEKIVDVTDVMQHQAPTIQTVHKMVEVPEGQYRDRVVDVPVAMQRHTSVMLKVTR